MLTNTEYFTFTSFYLFADVTRQLVVVTVHPVGLESFVTLRAKQEVTDKIVWRGVAARTMLRAIISQVYFLKKCLWPVTHFAFLMGFLGLSGIEVIFLFTYLG